MNDLAVRVAELADAEQIAGVHVRSWQAGYFGLIDQGILDGLSIADRAERWRSIITEPLASSLGTLVAIRAGQIVGWSSLGQGRDAGSENDGEIYGIYADPHAWSTGVGHALITSSERMLGEAGYARIYLWVLDGNERADSFYERHDFRADGALKRDERPGHTLLEHRRMKNLS